MPADYLIDAKHRMVFSRGRGTFSQDDFREHMRQLVNDPQFRPEYNQLVDCRAIEKMDLNGAQIEELARSSVFAPTSLRAFVATDKVQYGLSRMMATYRKINAGQEVQVFSEMKEALAWFGLPADTDPFVAKEIPNEHGQGL